MTMPDPQQAFLQQIQRTLSWPAAGAASAADTVDTKTPVMTVRVITTLRRQQELDGKYLMGFRSGRVAKTWRNAKLSVRPNP